MITIILSIALSVAFAVYMAFGWLAVIACAFVGLFGGAVLQLALVKVMPLRYVKVGDFKLMEYPIDGEHAVKPYLKQVLVTAFPGHLDADEERYKFLYADPELSHERLKIGTSCLACEGKVYQEDRAGGNVIFLKPEFKSKWMNYFAFLGEQKMHYEFHVPLGSVVRIVI